MANSRFSSNSKFTKYNIMNDAIPNDQNFKSMDLSTSPPQNGYANRGRKVHNVRSNNASFAIIIDPSSRDLLS
jgi:hypothetical protein